MVYAVQANLAFRNAARRDAVSQNIQTRLAQTVPWGEVIRVDGENMAGDPSVGLEVRFVTEAEADSFWTDAIAYVGTGINGPTTGSAFWRHDCPHDESDPDPCVESDRVDF